MKKLLLSAAFSVVTAIAAFSQSVDDIVNKHIDAMGGAANLKKFKTLILKGKTQANGVDINITTYQTHNVASRVEISVMGKTGYIINTMDKGWTFMPFAGQTKPEPMTEETVKKTAENLDLQGSLFDYKAKGHTVESLGEDDVDGTECYKLKLITKSGVENTVYINKADYLIIKTVSKSTINGKEVEQTSTASNYKKIEGLMIPFSIGTPMGELVIDTAEVNKEISSDLYKPEEKK